MAYNSPRFTRIYVQQQSAYNQFNNSAGTWSNSGAKVQRVDQNSITMNRVAPYTRFPVLTGTRSEQPGVRGRKAGTWEIRGMPLIPSGASSTAPDCDIILQNIFGQANSSGTYSFLDTGFLPFSLFRFAHGSTTLTSQCAWGCYVTSCQFNFNQPFITMDLQGHAGYVIDNSGFSGFDSQALAGLTAYPIEPSSPTVNGQPLAGFGVGYTFTVDSQALDLKVRVGSIRIETGFEQIPDVYGSPYPIGEVGNTRRISISLAAIDDDSSALNDLKLKADTDNVTIDASVVAGNTTNNTFTFTMKKIQLNAFDLRDEGALVNTEFGTSYAHATAITNTDDFSMQFS